MGEGRIRKIIHIDMDAFYASVEQRDNSDLKNRPVAVGYPAKRGVVAAASYEARRFGVRSAMPSTVAMRRCPELVFVAPRFDVYRAVSQQIHAIFKDYTLGGLRFVVRHQSREADKSQDCVPDETVADRRPGGLRRVVGNVR
jgi:nucleotidyltransferase/DNA polymerase involved in DNA repair